MEKFLFQQDVVVRNVKYRYAILRFRENGKFLYAGIIARINKGDTFELISSMKTDLFEDAVFFLKESAVNQFANMTLLTLNQELNELLR